eukprot:11215989-Lingulodinium_polyedra.AAC.1
MQDAYDMGILLLAEEMDNAQSVLTGTIKSMECACLAQIKQPWALSTFLHTTGLLFYSRK